MDSQAAAQLIAAVLAKTNPAGQWCPHTPHTKQQQFLELDCLEAMFGGAAGPGKSDALLMAALQHVDKPNYAALLLRRTYTDLALPGALMDRAAEWLRPTTARWNETLKQWRFPAGGTLTFGYLETEKDKYRYQGAELQYIAFDELTQFTETQYTYMLSRLRRLKGSKIPIRMRSASNPGGIGHDWVKRRFVDHDGADRTFVPARLEDNPFVDVDEYRRALAELDPTTRSQLEDGLWVRDSAGQLYRYVPERNDVDDLPERDDWRYVLAIDLGTSETKPTTAMTVLAFCSEILCVYVVFSQVYAGMTPSSIAEEAIRLRDGCDGLQAIVMDQGGLGAGYIKEMQQRWAIPVRPAEKANKLGYRKLLNGDLQNGLVKIVNRACDPLVQELQELQWNELGTDCEKGAVDHSTDSLLYGWREAKHWLAKEPEPQPKQGTQAWMIQEEQRLRTAAAERVRNASKRPWWTKGGR